MQYTLPGNHTNVLQGQLNLEQAATDLIRGHIAREKNPDVLIIGFSPLTDSRDNGAERHITFVHEDDHEIVARRYTLIVVNCVAQTVFHNGLVQVELSARHLKPLQLMEGLVPYLAIVQ